MPLPEPVKGYLCKCRSKSGQAWLHTPTCQETAEFYIVLPVSRTNQDWETCWVLGMWSLSIRKTRKGSLYYVPYGDIVRHSFHWDDDADDDDDDDDDEYHFNHDEEDTKRVHPGTQMFDFPSAENVSIFPMPGTDKLCFFLLDYHGDLSFKGVESHCAKQTFQRYLKSWFFQDPTFGNFISRGFDCWLELNEILVALCKQVALNAYRLKACSSSIRYLAFIAAQP